MSSNNNDNAFGLSYIANSLDSMKDDLHALDKRSEVMLEKLENHFKEDSQNLENITKSLESVQNHLEVYNKELAIHIAGTVELRRTNDILQKGMELHKQEMNTRLLAAEEPLQWLKTTKRIALWITAVSAAIVAAMTILGYLKIS